MTQRVTLVLIAMVIVAIALVGCDSSNHASPTTTITVTGTLINSDTSALASCDVYLGATKETTTDANGSFSFTASSNTISGQYLYFQLAGSTQQIKSATALTVPASGTTLAIGNMTVAVITVIGTLVDNDDNNIAKCSVYLGTTKETTTDANGRFSFSAFNGAISGQYLYFQLVGSTQLIKAATALTVPNSGTTLNLFLTVTEAILVNGRLVHVDTSAIASSDVYLETTRVTTTDANGYFQFTSSSSAINGHYLYFQPSGSTQQIKSATALTVPALGSTLALGTITLPN